jgi:hypothetical protein
MKNSQLKLMQIAQDRVESNDVAVILIVGKYVAKIIV